MSKNSAYPNKHIHLCEIFHKAKYLPLEKVIPMAKFANHYFLKNDLQGWLYHWFLNLPKKTCQQKNVIPMDGVAIQYRNML